MRSPISKEQKNGSLLGQSSLNMSWGKSSSWSRMSRRGQCGGNEVGKVIYSVQEGVRGLEDKVRWGRGVNTNWKKMGEIRTKGFLSGSMVEINERLGREGPRWVGWPTECWTSMMYREQREVGQGSLESPDEGWRQPILNPSFRWRYGGSFLQRWKNIN